MQERKAEREQLCGDMRALQQALEAMEAARVLRAASEAATLHSHHSRISRWGGHCPLPLQQ